MVPSEKIFLNILYLLVIQCMTSLILKFFSSRFPTLPIKSGQKLKYLENEKNF